MPGGYTGKILRVDLSTGQFSIDRPDDDKLRDFIGGEGLGIRYLYDEVPPGTDALGPANKLFFMTGPVTGSLAPTSGRHCVTTRSPLTGCQNTSHAGGYWGTQLKLAGYDGIIIQGHSEKPVYLFIDDGKPELYDASGIWGRDVFQTDVLIKDQLHNGKISIASIGPAGENLVKFASIQNDRQRSAARGGSGAVMGSKNLKAIAVRGTQSFYAADPVEYIKSMDELLLSTYDNVLSGDLLPKYGVTGIMDMINHSGALPTRNNQSGTFDQAHELSGQKMAQTILTRTRGCFCCNIHCTRLVNVEYGPYHGTRGKGPDYDAAVALGSQCGNGDLESVARANLLCDQYGLDAVTAGDSIAWAMELFERGLIDRHDTRGIDLRFGNHEAIVAMIPKIATRMEFGAVLADGLAEASKKVGKGSDRYAMAVKNMSLPGFEARGSKAMALQYAVDNRGGDDLRPYASVAECMGFRSKELQMPEHFDPVSEAGVVQWLVPAQHYSVAVNSLVCCMFTIIGYSIEPGQYARHLSAITGFHYDKDSLLLAGERIWNLQRAFNIRDGFGGKDDRLPERLTTEPAPSGPPRGSIVHLDPMLDAYYQARGWDLNGIPTREKLKMLGLEHISRDLDPARAEAGEQATT